MSFRAAIRVALTCDPEGDGRVFEIDCLYCDDCHRWGRTGSTHICNENWFQTARDLIAELLAEED